MLDWLKNLGGEKLRPEASPPPYSNKAGLNTEAIDLMAADFARLNRLRPGSSHRLLRFVLDDEDDAVLPDLEVLTAAGHALDLLMLNYKVQANGHGKLIDAMENPSPAMLLRLAKVYAAAGKADGMRAPFRLPAELTPILCLVFEAMQVWPHQDPPRFSVSRWIDAKMLETLLELEGHPADALVRVVFSENPNRYSCGLPPKPLLAYVPGFPENIARHWQAVLPFLTHQDIAVRRATLEILRLCQPPPEPFLKPAVELALSSSKQVREIAEAYIATARELAVPLLRRAIAEGGNAEKPHAVRLLWKWDGENARPFLQEQLAIEKHAKTREAIEAALATASPDAPQDDAVLQLPPLDPVPSEAPLGPEAERAWRECLNAYNHAAARLNTKLASNKYFTPLRLITEEMARASFRLLQMGGSHEALLPGTEIEGHGLQDCFKALWQIPGLGLVHLARYIILTGFPDGRRMEGTHYSYSRILPYVRNFCRIRPETGLRELGAGFEAAGLTSASLGAAILMSWNELPAPFGLPPEKIWPYWAEHLDLLEKAFAPAPQQQGQRMYGNPRANALFALATFPQPPARLAPILWELALGPKGERAAARRCLESAPDKLERIVRYLSSRDAETRHLAAEWLGRIGDARTIEPLLAALKREKSEFAKGAMMSALEAVGAPVEQFLNRESLLKEATEVVARGVPSDLLWFPFERLPVVHWADNGQALDPVIPRAWAIQAYRLKSPEPGPLLRKYCGGLEASGREALGQFVLEAWLAEDVATITPAEAEKRATIQAQQYVQYCQSQHWPQNLPRKTFEEFYAQFLPGFLAQPRGSATASRGVLALAAACAGAGAAPLVARYLKEWYGARASQCRALLQMLSWIEHRTATQVLLAIGTRFRTRSIQDEANRLAQALAERQGWTVSELADRTIPTAGMDDDGILSLDYGPRQFTARLNEELEFVLSDPDGKTLKSLPDPRKDDDATKAAEAKKSFAAAKKELKSVVTMQRERLYEAMCTQRTWTFEDWNTYLNRHPVVRHHCQRLVWGVQRGGKLAVLFRPLPDGSLTDAADDPVTVQPEDMVSLAHECHLTPDQSAQWRQHLKDYEIEPLFEQFGRQQFELSPESRDRTEVEDFRGHVLEAFKFRGRAIKLGYTRGQAQDAGWFYEYTKRFPTLGIEAIIEFTGNSLPEENRMVAVAALHFDRIGPDAPDAFAERRVPVGDVPPVLLSECWNDVRQIAGEGSGFDPNWEKTTQP